MTAGTSTRKRAALAVLSAVLFLTFLDTTIVSVALADIQKDLSAGVTALQWIVNGYAVVFAALMLGGGTLGDLFGRKKVMLGGVAVFCTGSVICALAPDSTVLITGRVVMGIGAAASEPGTLSMLRHIYPEDRERARALGVWAAVSGLGLALGPVIGGAIVGLASWREVFWFNLAFGAVAFVMAAITLPENADPQGRHVDIAGIGLGAIGLGAASYGVIEGEAAGYSTWWIIVLFAVAVLAAVGFVLVERRAADPVLDLAYLRRPAFTGANTVAFTTFFGIFALFFFVALYVQLIGTNSPYQTALEFLPMAVGMIAASALTGRWVARSGPRAPMALGCLLAGVGILLTESYLSPTVGIGTLGWTMAVAGVGFGMAIVPVTSTALSVVPPERSGMAAGATNTSREVGAVFGVAVLGAVIDSELTAHLKESLDRLDIPANFQSIVIYGVTHGGSLQAPTTGPGATGGTGGGGGGGGSSIAQTVAKVIKAAQDAFGAGIEVALLLSGAMLLAAAVLALLTIHARSDRLPGAPAEPDGRP